MRFWLYLGLACLGWLVSEALERSTSDRLLRRIEEKGWGYLERAAVSFDANVAVSLLSDSHEDERERTTSTFYLRVYDTKEGRPLTEPLRLYTRKSPKHRHPAVPDGPFITPDGKYALVGCYFPQQELRIYDIEARRFQDRTVPVPTVGSACWSASADGRVAYQTGAGFVVVDPKTASVVGQWQNPQEGVTVKGVALDPRGRLVATATSHGIWLSSLGSSDPPRQVFPGEASAPTFAQGGKRLVFLHQGQVGQLEVPSGRLVGKPIGDGYSHLEVSADGRVALASNSNLADVLELPSGKLRCRRQRSSSGLKSELLSAAGDKVFATERKESGYAVLVWETRRGQERFVLTSGGYLRSPEAISPDGRVGLTSEGDNISLWRL